ncbi:MBL fold metallo-hydrolase [Brucella cytisi]|uniref:MBL fold metallo-hydrolase n=1 Tax=Brucella cytisi TaxID=407152 RepID=A0A1J6HWV1_9HYPH|nr:MBL fold metallo-hydrolase [Brucella cytisi]OIS92703.1 MBL fold metallo-hydrolase [Brucella cytisi]
MTDKGIRVRFWGTRGSIPVSGPDFEHYGGNTPCIELQCGEHRLIFDAGSGIREAGEAMVAEGVSQCNLFFTHSHYDHIMGLPYFSPVYNPAAQVKFWSGHLHGLKTTRELLNEFMRPPFFPIAPDVWKANVEFQDFQTGDDLIPCDGVIIRTGDLNHPGGCVGYRIEWAGKSVALIYDTEHVGDRLDPNVLALIGNVDLMVYDCTYTDDEMKRCFGYGHSTWRHGVQLAKAAAVKSFALFHHAPNRTDQALDECERATQELFPLAFAARDRQVVMI